MMLRGTAILLLAASAAGFQDPPCVDAECGARSDVDTVGLLQHLRAGAEEEWGHKGQTGQKGQELWRGQTKGQGPAPTTPAPTTPEPTPAPTPEPTPAPTPEPTPEPTPAPTPEPTPPPTPKLTANPNQPQEPTDQKGQKGQKKWQDQKGSLIEVMGPKGSKSQQAQQVSQQEVKHVVEVFTPRYQQKCFGAIGQLCSEGPCPEDSSSICQRGKCVCKAGCAGTDGKCHAEENSLIAARFNLRNARWPEHHLYVKDVSLYQQMGLTDHPGAEAKFSLYSMPSRVGGNGYVLASDKLANNETVAVVAPTHGLILRLEPQALFAQSLHEADRKNLGPHEVSLTVCSLRSETRPGTVMIGGGEPIAWALGKSTSWEVFAHENNTNLDDSSHWLTDPPIPESELESCTGAREKWQPAMR